MQAITVKRVLIFVIAVCSLSLMVGCSGMEKDPQTGPDICTIPRN